MEYKKNILIDLSSSQPQGEMTINGGGEYAYTVFNKLVENKHIKFYVLLNSNLGDNISVNNICFADNVEVLYFSGVKDINSILNSTRVDKFFIPVCYSKYCELIVNNNIELITVIHDLCELYYYKLPVKYGKYIDGPIINLLRFFRDLFLNKIHERKVIERHNRLIELSQNQKVITVSNYSKSAMIYYLDVDDMNKIRVLYTPEKIIKNSSDINNWEKENNDLNYKRFFLLSAGCRWTKNNAIVLLTIDKMLSKVKYKSLLYDFKVVVLGVNDRFKKYYCNKIKNIDSFIFKGYVTDSELEFLYSNAYMFIFPSMLEGFGMPPIEALQNGTLTACSTAMSIPEICSSSVIYFDPMDIESIELAIIRGLDRSYSDNILSNRFVDLDKLSQKRLEDLDTLVNLIID